MSVRGIIIIMILFARVGACGALLVSAFVMALAKDWSEVARCLVIAVLLMPLDEWLEEKRKRR